MLWNLITGEKTPLNNSNLFPKKKKNYFKTFILLQELSFPRVFTTFAQSKQFKIPCRIKQTLSNRLEIILRSNYFHTINNSILFYISFVFFSNYGFCLLSYLSGISTYKFLNFSMWLLFLLHEKRFEKKSAKRLPNKQ